MAPNMIGISIRQQESPLMKSSCHSVDLNIVGMVRKRKRGSGSSDCVADHPNRKPEQTTSPMRTGCIPCLRKRVKCDASNPDCRRRVINEDWRMNRDITTQWQGSWRERRSMHLFVNFATSPQRAGLFESTFWHHTVLLACVDSEAVKCLATAIGATQEYIFKQSPDTSPIDNDQIAFSLRQCNRAIKLLTASSSHSSQTLDDPTTALITCVLFAVFEALQGDQTQAIGHALQARKLLQSCEHLAAKNQLSRLVDPTEIRPIICGLEIQAKALQGRGMSLSEASNDTTLPTVETLHSLEHAHWTLHYTYISLLTFNQHMSLDEPAVCIAEKSARKQTFFLPWLHRWEESFATFLFREASSLTPHDMTRAKVLKANHITATVLSTTDPSKGQWTWDPFDKECKAIIDLCVPVLNSYSLGPDAKLSSFQFPYLTFGLWIDEPLFAVMARCRNPDLRRQAAGLLSGHSRPSPAHKMMRRRVRGCPGVDEALLEPSDTAEWTTDQWIEFCMKTRFDAAMATYFARLPSGFIDKPAFRP